jgi:hypothetical protein
MFLFAKIARIYLELNGSLSRALFWVFFQVRIEDCITVTETGAENFVTVPRTVEDIEQLMASN